MHLKATCKISPLEELVGGDLPPSSSQRLTGMRYWFLYMVNIKDGSQNVSGFFTWLTLKMAAKTSVVS